MISYGFVVGIVVFCIGFFLVIQDMLSVKKHLILEIDLSGIVHKNNLPILPRNQRDLTKIATITQVLLCGKAYFDKTNNLSDSLPKSSKTSQIIRDSHEQTTQNITVTQKNTNMSHIKQSSTAQFSNSDRPSDSLYGEMSMLDDYFRKQHQQTTEDNDVLFNHKQTLTVIITPRGGEGVSGTKIIDVARQYGMKYGVLNMFHRYENPEGVGMLWFSMLGVASDGVKSFDLFDLPQMTYRGLAFFLALPHPQALRGFDSMVQVAQTVGIELDADIHDESDYIIDANRFNDLRTYVGDYHIQS